VPSPFLSRDSVGSKEVDNDEASGTAFAARVHHVPRPDGGIRRGFQFSATNEEPTREEFHRLDFNDVYDGSGGS